VNNTILSGEGHFRSKRILMPNNIVNFLNFQLYADYLSVLKHNLKHKLKLEYVKSQIKLPSNLIILIVMSILKHCKEFIAKNITPAKV